MDKCLIIDGNSLLYRVYYASIKQLDYFKEHNLTPNNAIKLMIDLCFKLKKSKDYKYGIVAFDCGSCDFRTQLLDSYKANRSKMPEELYIQLQPIQDVLTLMGYKVITNPGFEADDIIGSISHLLANHNCIVDIFSSDKDMLQLINEKINVNLIKKGLTDIEIYNHSNICELIGLSPQQVIDYKAIVGDPSDNIEGVKGIGPKTGLKLINEYNSLANLLANLDQLDVKIKDKFATNKDYLLKLQKVITIKKDLYDNSLISEFLFNNEQKEEISNFLKKWHINGMDKYL